MPESVRQAPNEFLIPDTAPDVSGLDTVAFYPFKDGSAGAAATAVENTVDASLFPGTGANIGSGSVTFSAACPGRYVFADTRYSSVIQENPQSLCFVNGTSGNGGKMSLASLATVLSRLDAYTVEFFFMVQSTADYRTLVGWKYGDRVGVKANMRISNGASYACEFQAVTNTTGGTVVTAGASGRHTLSMKCSTASLPSTMPAWRRPTRERSWKASGRRCVGRGFPNARCFIRG